MATGPALRRLESHQSIHNGAHAEARDLIEVTEKLFKDNRQQDCLKAANMLVEYIESRIIAHADAEDEGFYLETLEKKPDLKQDVYMLMRDHDLMRKLVRDVKSDLNRDNVVTESIINKFHTIIIIHDYHAHSEESILFNE